MQAILDILAKVGFDWRMGLFNLVNFLIIFWLLKRYFFAPIVEVIETRKAHAREVEENFQQSKTELAMAEHKAQAIIDDAKVEANKVVEASADEARAIADKMKDKAKSEIELLVAQAKKNIEIDRRDMQDKLKDETVDLVIKTAKAVLGNKIDSAVDERIIKKSITK